VRGGERDYPMPPIVNWLDGFRTAPWRPPPPTPSQLYAGRADKATGHTAGVKRALKQLGKHDDELHALWEQRLSCNRLRHLAIVLEAEVSAEVRVGDPRLALSRH
jgi:hypothetical protein